MDHCGEYTKRTEEDDEIKQKVREALGVYNAFQRRECNRGDSLTMFHINFESNTMYNFISSTNE